MNKFYTKKISVIASAGMLALLSACGGSSSGGSSVGDGTVSGGSTEIISNDFSFPTVGEANGVVSVAIPNGPMPAFPARRMLSAGAGNAIEFGDPVVVKYNMYSWATGELVESTDNFDEPVTIRAGLSQGIPDYLSNSLLGRNVGDRLQVVFQAGMEDLPEYLDNTDAYVLVLDLI